MERDLTMLFLDTVVRNQVDLGLLLQDVDHLLSYIISSELLLDNVCKGACDSLKLVREGKEKTNKQKK